MLGLSLGRLLELGEGATLVRALGQLIEEYEHFIGSKRDLVGVGGPKSAEAIAAAASAASASELLSSAGQAQQLLTPFLFLGTAHGSAHVQAVVAVAAQQAAAGGGHSSLGGGGSGAGDRGDREFKPALHRVAKVGVVYDYLQSSAPCMVDHLDYCEVVHSLCDVLALLYAKLNDASCQSGHVHDAILRVDRKVKTLVLAKITNDLTQEVVQPLLKAELAAMLNHTFVQADDKAAMAGMRKFVRLDDNDTASAFVDDDYDDDDAK